MELLDDINYINLHSFKTHKKESGDNKIEKHEIAYKYLISEVSPTTQQRIWIIAPGEDAKIWEECKAEGYIAIGWDKINVNSYESKNAIKQDLIIEYNEKPNTRKQSFLWSFAYDIQVDDIVIARKGRSDIIGIGHITSSYISPRDRENPRKNRDYKQIRKVNWENIAKQNTENGKLFAMGTVSEVNKNDERIKNLVISFLENTDRTANTTGEVNFMKKRKFNGHVLKYTFPYYNILLKGVPGTGKSRTLENIINKQLNLEKHYDTNVLRINVHSASSNADLMQGIGISSNDEGHIEYKEKQGLILELIEQATFNPKQPFVLVLEEIQENSLNELIGDLIYLIEDSKRAKGYEADNKEYTYRVPSQKVWVNPHLNFLKPMINQREI